MGPYLYFRVLNFTVLASLTQRMSIQFACIQQWFRFKLFSNFDFYLCLCINFHTSPFRVLIFAGSLLGPYFTKKWVLIGSLSQSLGVFISFRGSGHGHHGHEDNQAHGTIKTDRITRTHGTCKTDRIVRTRYRQDRQVKDERQDRQI